MLFNDSYVGERKIALKAIVGSCNYNTNNSLSDKDYKIFTLPTYDDLYDGQRFKKSIVGESEDFDIHDIRKLENLLFKSNVNYTEVLFSEELSFGEGLNKKSIELLEGLLEKRESIAAINLPYFYKSSFGMFNQRFACIEKGSIHNKNLVERFGYDTKQASQAYRILDFLVRYADREFQDFKGAIYYKEKEARDVVMGIKEGRYSISEFSTLINRKNREAENLEEVYCSKEEDAETHLFLRNTLKELILTDLSSLCVE